MCFSKQVPWPPAVWLFGMGNVRHDGKMFRSSEFGLVSFFFQVERERWGGFRHLLTMKQLRDRMDGIGLSPRIFLSR